MSHGPPRKQINLYLAEFRPPQHILPTHALLFGAAIFAAGLAALHLWDVWRLGPYRQEADQAEARAALVERQLAQLTGEGTRADPAIIAEAESLEARILALRTAQDSIAAGALGSETGYAAHFQALSRARVPGAWLTRIEVAEAGKAMSLEGRALHGEDPARLIAMLGRQPMLAGLTYAGLEVQPPTPETASAGPAPETASTPARTADYLEFTLAARLENPDAKPAQSKAGGGP
ncbi:MAG: hypothetical protein AB1421_02830 [Pseudomonadota bacterium]